MSRRLVNKIICQYCGKKFHPWLYSAKFCSHRCNSKSRIGEKAARWNGGKIHKICGFCKKRFSIYPSGLKNNKGQYCSPECFGKFNKNKFKNKTLHPRWIGGVIKDERGYVYIYSPNHPHAHNNYVKRSRLVMEKYLGRFLLTEEIVHHIDGTKDDDRIENLELMTPSTHAHLHFKLYQAGRKHLDSTRLKRKKSS